MAAQRRSVHFLEGLAEVHALDHPATTGLERGFLVALGDLGGDTALGRVVVDDPVPVTGV